jgi:hypothetical protein
VLDPSELLLRLYNVLRWPSRPLLLRLIRFFNQGAPSATTLIPRVVAQGKAEMYLPSAFFKTYLVLHALSLSDCFGFDIHRLARHRKPAWL